MTTLDFGPTTAALAAPDPAARRRPAGRPDAVPGLHGGATWWTTSAGWRWRSPLRRARRTSPGGGNPSADGSNLQEGWRDRIAAERLAELGEAWTDPAAYEGMTQAGPIEMPAEIAALVAIDEVTVHAWDLAVATGQHYDGDPVAVAAAHGFASSFEPPEGGAADDGGLFGPPVPVPDDAPALDRLLGATGRDPRWSPPSDSAA